MLYKYHGTFVDRIQTQDGNMEIDDRCISCERKKGKQRHFYTEKKIKRINLVNSGQNQTGLKV